MGAWGEGGDMCMAAYKYPFMDHMGPGPVMAFNTRGNGCCLVNSSIYYNRKNRVLENQCYRQGA